MINKKIKVGRIYSQPSRLANAKTYPKPCIKIAGNYLQNLGFQINSEFTLTSSTPGEIVLKIL